MPGAKVKSMPRKPDWLRKKINPARHSEMHALFRQAQLHTVCEEAMCPNITECFRARQATFLIMGKECTRACSFCSVSKGEPLPLQEGEPERVALTVKTLGLQHVVITSPTRDDLNDGGAEHFAKTVEAIKTMDPKVTVELLIPDMKADPKAIARVAECGAEIVGHNIETVPRLYHIRKGASYERSLRVLEMLAEANPAIQTKSALMLGLGEEKKEVLETMQDLLDVNCRLLSIGQYLAPSTRHTPVIESIAPETFDRYREIGMDLGFGYIKSSPYTRSSYLAHDYIKEAE